MTDFLAQAPTLDANWRAVVLFGRNVASYKFALAKALLGLAGCAKDRVPLEELATPFARHLCEHLKLVDKQTTSRSSKFLDVCRAFNRNELSEDALAREVEREFAVVSRLPGDGVPGAAIREIADAVGVFPGDVLGGAELDPRAE